ncbi:MAG: hypothetical protein HY459_03860 [Parcubacteria group bacterium]|nr:hypothetical protein [Parcubacteria group bacterium]
MAIRFGRHSITRRDIRKGGPLEHVLKRIHILSPQEIQSVIGGIRGLTSTGGEATPSELRRYLRELNRSGDSVDRIEARRVAEQLEKFLEEKEKGM